MNLSVFKLSYRKKYYFLHPIQFIKEIFGMIRDMFHRAKYGWAYSDVWNLNDWLIGILPPMLRHMADYGCAYPGDVKFDTPEKWNDWLHSMADVLESLQEENWYGQNEYEKEWSEIPFKKHLTEEEEILRQAYWDREIELETNRQNLQQKTFKELIENLDCLWD